MTDETIINPLSYDGKGIEVGRSRARIPALFSCYRIFGVKDFTYIANDSISPNFRKLGLFLL